MNSRVRLGAWIPMFGGGPRFHKRSSALAAIGGLTVVALGYAPSLWADEWAVEPAVTIRSQYHDNIQLTPAPHDSVSVGVLSPEVSLRKKTEISDIALRGKIDVNRYWGDSSLNTTDQSYNLNSAFIGERTKTGLDAGFVRDSTLRSELIETGIVAARTQRSSLRLNPHWSWNISPLMFVGASYGFSDVRYDSPQSAGLTNYRNQDVSFWIGRKISEQDEVQLATTYSNYVTRPATYESDTLGVSLSYTRDFSERTKLTSRFGAQRTKSSRQAFSQVYVPIDFFPFLVSVPVLQRIDHSDTGMQLDVGLTSQWTDRTGLRGRVSRDLNPSGVGSLVQTDKLSAGISHGFGERTSVDADLSAYRTKFTDDLLSASNSRYYTFETRLNSRLDEHWSVSAGYNYARRQYQGGTAADANTIFVSARYDWRKIAISR